MMLGMLVGTASRLGAWLLHMHEVDLIYRTDTD